MKPHLLLAALLPLAACGDYPQPFAGNPGRLGAMLAVPPPPRLVVPAPAEALLAQAGAATFATDLATELANHAVPAIAIATAATAHTDWRLAVTAETTPAGVVPTYTVTNPKGFAQGSTAAPPIPPPDWSSATPTILARIASRDAPAISALLDRIKASIQQSDPNSLVNRPARLLMQGVTGAPGDGNTLLRHMITSDLADLGIVVQNTPRGADYALAGTVHIVPSGTPGQSRVEIQWTVHDPYGTEAGHLLQMNDIPTGTLDTHWGDVAAVVAQEAASGVREVLTNQLAAGSKGRPGLRPGPAGVRGPQTP